VTSRALAVGLLLGLAAIPRAARGATPLDPAVGTVARFGPPPNPTLYIWIWGTVNPAATAKPGVSVGTVVVSLVYR
jgi:hypothetical protein